MRFTTLLFIFALVLAVYLRNVPAPTLESDFSGPNCHMCEVILNNVRYEYRNNFTGVTPDQLRLSLYQQCDMYLNGFTDDECHRKADEDSDDVLRQLQDGTSSYKICQNEDIC